MNGYLFSLCTAAIVAGMVMMLCPENAALKKYMSFLVGLCTVCTLIMPLKRALAAIPTVIESTALFAGSDEVEYDASGVNEYFLAALEDEIATAARDSVAERFGVDVTRADAETQYNAEANTVRLLSITVEVNGGRYAVSDVKKYLSEVFDCDIYVFACDGGDENGRCNE